MAVLITTLQFYLISTSWGIKSGKTLQISDETIHQSDLNFVLPNEI